MVELKMLVITASYIFMASRPSSNMESFFILLSIIWHIYSVWISFLGESTPSHYISWVFRGRHWAIFNGPRNVPGMLKNMGIDELDHYLKFCRSENSNFVFSSFYRRFSVCSKSRFHRIPIENMQGFITFITVMVERLVMVERPIIL